MKKMAAKINSNLVVFALGLAVFCVGVGLIYLPAAMVAGGAILMAISLFGEARP